MSYSIKKTTVTLTCEQMRAIIATLEAVRDAMDLQDARRIAVTTLEGMKQQEIISEHDYSYGLPPAGETDVEQWQRRAQA